MLISSLCSYFHPMNVFIWQKSHFVDKYVQNAKFSKWQKSNLHRALRGRTITAPHKSIEYIGLHMTIFLHNHTKMKLFTHWNVEIRSGTLLSSIYYSTRIMFWNCRLTCLEIGPVTWSQDWWLGMLFHNLTSWGKRHGFLCPIIRFI